MSNSLQYSGHELRNGINSELPDSDLDEDAPLIPALNRRNVRVSPQIDEEAQPKLHLLANTGAPLGLVPEGPIESRCPSFKQGIRYIQQKSIHLPSVFYHVLGEIWGTFVLVFIIEMEEYSSPRQ